MKTAQRHLPSVRSPHFVVWTLDPDGTFTSAFGALERFGGTTLVGNTIWDLSNNRPDIRAIFARLLAGSVVRESCEAAGQTWMVEAQPIIRDGEVVGASGVVWPVESDPPSPRRRVWELRGMPRGGRYRDGDRITHIEGVSGGLGAFYLPESELLSLHVNFGPQMHLIEDTALTPPRHLSVVR